MTDEAPELEKLVSGCDRQLKKIALDTQHGYSFAKISHIYDKLKRMGPWRQEDLSMELMFDIDTLQSALAVEYGRIFASGTNHISPSKVPSHLKETHDEIILLRNKRYAHYDEHPSIENLLEIQADGGKLTIHPKAIMGMHLGAPRHWEPLIKWLGEYLHDQTQRVTKRLSKDTGYEWTYAPWPAPDEES
ncbi:hypothetical protein [Thioclava sp. F28-4]|uniref:hypothetical protein n=1 Tax=Thioclava sp. F28-4 TaxID=1915315 RepID=UPI00099843CA|nr:hypothetical protein [Thioclava sp. F28-4]OOY02864.1 hypothetical protein BMI87_20635 [Thioclava sp. F28-4]